MKYLFLLLLCGCADDVAQTQGAFTRLEMDREMRLAKCVLKEEYGWSEDVDPYVWKGPLANVQALCGPEAGACLVGNDILIADDPSVDRCWGLLHETGHYMEWLRSEVDYNHDGKLADWYVRQIPLLCELMK